MVKACPAWLWGRVNGKSACSACAFSTESGQSLTLPACSPQKSAALSPATARRLSSPVRTMAQAVPSAAAAERSYTFAPSRPPSRPRSESIVMDMGKTSCKNVLKAWTVCSFKYSTIAGKVKQIYHGRGA